MLDLALRVMLLIPTSEEVEIRLRGVVLQRR